MRFPDFFIIGAPKCGTTALSEYLRLHPNVYFSNPKEPEYFASDFTGRVIDRESAYLRLFQLVDSSRHLTAGEGSVAYIFSRVAVPNIMKCQPEAKILVMLRNPAELVVSLHAELFRGGSENLPNFLDAWNAEADRKKGRRVSPGCRDRQWVYYSEWGKLGTQLERVMRVVPTEQLKVILYDDFARHTRKVYQDTLRFLGVPDDGRTEFPRVNERHLPKNVGLMKVIAMAMSLWLPFRSRLTRGRGLGIGNFLNRFITRPVESKEVPQEIYQLLVDYFCDETHLLENLLNRDLTHWYS